MSKTQLPELPFLSPALGYEVQDKVARDMIRDYAHAYGLAVWKAAMDAAVKTCDAQCEVYGAKMAQARDAGMDERWDRFHGYAEAVENIAAAIRSLPEPAVIQQGEKGE